MSQSPTLQELVSASNDYALSNVYTAIPGVVISVEDMGECRLNVQPTINIRSEGGDINTPRPPILNVPFLHPISQQGGLTYPIAPGNPIWLKFSMRGLEIWKRGNGMPEAPADMRRFDPRDCVAEPAYPFSMSPNLPSKRTWPHSTDDVVLVHNIGTGSEVEIRLKPNGEVVVNSPTKVTVNCENAVINSKVDTTVNCGESAVVNTGGDAVVNSQGNVSIKNEGWSQVVSSGSVLIKSEEAVKIQGPSGSLIL